MGRWRANMHHGNGSADWSGLLMAGVLWELGNSMQGKGCGCGGLMTIFVLLSPFIFIYALIKGDYPTVLFFGFITLVMLLATICTIIQHQMKKRKIKFIEKKMQEEWKSEHVRCIEQKFIDEQFWITCEVERKDGSTHHFSVYDSTLKGLETKMKEEIEWRERCR